MKILRQWKSIAVLVLTLVLTLGMVHPGEAQSLPKSLVIGSSPPGSLYYVIAAGFTKVLNAHTPMKAEAFPQGTTVWLPMLLSNEVHVGVISPAEALCAYLGTDIYQKLTGGKGYPLRTLMLGAPLQAAFVVPGDSSIKTPEDVRGKRVPVDYGAYLTTTLSTRSILASYGLTAQDVKGLSVTSYPSGVQAVIDGRADAATASIGSAIVEELKAARGVRYLSVGTSAEAVAEMQKVHPGYYPALVKPGPTAVTEGLYALTYDINFAAVESTPEEVAYTVTKVLWENQPEMAPIHPTLKQWTTDKFVSTHAVLPYHKGSIRFYKEKNVWTGEMEEHQKKLLALKK